LLPKVKESVKFEAVLAWLLERVRTTRRGLPVHDKVVVFCKREQTIKSLALRLWKVLESEYEAEMSMEKSRCSRRWPLSGKPDIGASDIELRRATSLIWNQGGRTEMAGS
jgi:hypothetical protein